MKTFYSILYAVIRPETDEKIAVGLLLSNGDDSRFHHSKQKLSAVRSLFGVNEYKYIQHYIAAVKRTVTDSVKNLNQQSIFEITGYRHEVINESYLNYLSIYSKNVTWFSKPLQIDIQVNKENFSTLFKKLIDNKFMKILSVAAKAT